MAVAIKNLERESLLLRPAAPQLEYQPAKGETGVMVWGQRKLFFSVLVFYMYYIKPWIEAHPDQPRPTLVYIGAAPGYNIGMLASLMNVNLILYDMRDIKVVEPANADDKLKSIFQRITKIIKEFTDDDARQYANTNVFLYSDIRRSNEEEKVIEDMNTQRRWVELMNPIRACLKFRLRYSATGSETTDLPARYFEYLDGDIWFQPYARQHSTETRLVTRERSALGFPTKIYDNLAYESQLYYHNEITRRTSIYNNPVTKQRNPFDIGRADFGLDESLHNSWDTMAEVFLWNDYLKPLIGTQPTNVVETTIAKLVVALDIQLDINPTVNPDTIITVKKLAADPSRISRAITEKEDRTAEPVVQTAPAKTRTMHRRTVYQN